MKNPHLSTPLYTMWLWRWSCRISSCTSPRSSYGILGRRRFSPVARAVFSGGREMERRWVGVSLSLCCLVFLGFFFVLFLPGFCLVCFCLDYLLHHLLFAPPFSVSSFCSNRRPGKQQIPSSWTIRISPENMRTY